MITVPYNAAPWAQALVQSIQIYVDAELSQPLRMPTYLVADLPDPARFKDCLIKISNETGGDTACESDGTNWRRMTDRAVAS